MSVVGESQPFLIHANLFDGFAIEKLGMASESRIIALAPRGA